MAINKSELIVGDTVRFINNRSSFAPQGTEGTIEDLEHPDAYGWLKDEIKRYIWVQISGNPGPWPKDCWCAPVANVELANPRTNRDAARRMMKG